MPYTATDDLDLMVVTSPLGTDSPADLDDALRETRLVTKTVIKNAHTKKGAKRIAFWKQVITAALPSGTINQWNRRALATLVDPTSILTAGTYTSSIKPIAGVYAVRFWAVGYKLDNFMARVAEATANTTAPSAANEIDGLEGSFMFSNNADGVMTTSQGCGLITTDGSKSYCLDMRHSVANAVDGYGKAASGGWVGTAGENVVAAIEFDLLALAL